VLEIERSLDPLQRKATYKREEALAKLPITGPRAMGSLSEGSYKKQGKSGESKEDREAVKGTQNNRIRGEKKS